MYVYQGNKEAMERGGGIVYESKVITEPGEVVSVDQLVSPTPGFIVKMIGCLTTKIYDYATVFLD